MCILVPVPGIYFHSGSLPQRRRSRDAHTDLTDHTNTTIVVYLDYLLNIHAVYRSNIFLWSDGTSSRFKNRFMARFMEMSEEKHASNISWNFFATSHGKGAVDGVGGEPGTKSRQDRWSSEMRLSLRTQRKIEESSAIFSQSTQER